MAEHELPDLNDLIKKHLALREAVGRNPRYPLDAYVFVCEAVDYTCEKLGGRRDVTGRELLDGLCDLAVERFAFLAPTVLKRWNIASTDDVGEIVFTLVGVGLLGKSPRDSKADFHQLFDLEDELARRHTFETNLEETPGED